MSEHFQISVIVYLAGVLLAVAIVKIVIIAKELSAGLPRAFTLGQTVQRRLGDFVVQCLLMGSLYVGACSKPSPTKLAVIVFGLGGIGVMCYRLTREFLGQETFIARSHSLGPRYVCAVYFFHFLRNYFYIIWVFACIGLSLYLLGDEGASAYNLLEANRSQSLFIDFFYFTVVTVSTLGYGDIQPVSVGAKLVSIVEVLVGVFVLLSYVSIVLGNFLTQLSAKEKGVRL